jgi:hypothetical protein
LTIDPITPHSNSLNDYEMKLNKVI